jgi:integrase
MRGSTYKRGKSRSIIVDRGKQPARRCANGCTRVRVWVEDDRRDTCPRCDGPLDEPRLERRQQWQSAVRSSKDTDEALRKALGRVDLGDNPIPEKITVAELAVRFFDHMEAMGKPSTKVRRGYESSIRRDVLPMIGGLEVRTVKPAHVQAVLNKFKMTHADKTVTRLRNVMSSMFRIAVAWDLCPVNPVPATSTPAGQKKKLTIPEPDQVRDINEAARGGSYETPIFVASYTGARRSEVLGLAWSNVDLERGTVRIERTLQRVGAELVFSPETKTAHGRRTVPLPRFVVERLREHRAAQARRRLAAGGEWVDLDLVCDRGNGQPIDPDLLSQAFKRAAKAAGVDGVRLHDLRHAFATRLAHSGLHPVETSEILGHSSPSFTMSVYQHVDQESLERTRSAIEDAFGQSGF